LILLQALIVILCILAGSKKGGVNLGLFSALGLCVLYIIFNIKLSSPPVGILLLILSIILASSAVEACGGINFLIYKASRLIKTNPKRINYYSPLICYFLTLVSGTGHIIYSLLPIIAESSKKEGFRTEFPLSMGVIASQQAVLASPISASTVLLFTILSSYQVKLLDIFVICFPATLLSVLSMTLVILYLKKDKLYELSSLKEDSKIDTYTFDKSKYPFAIRAIVIYFLGIIVAICLSMGVGRDSFTQSSQTHVIQMTMLAVAGVILIFCKIPGTCLVKQRVFINGTQAIIAILGVSWLSDSFIFTNKEFLLSACFEHIKIYPWSFCLLAFVASMFLYSQSVTVQLLYPLAVSVGISPYLLIAFYPSVGGYFFIPNYPTMIAAIEFDKTGSTKIGSYILNHSFMLPGALAIVFSLSYSLLFTYLKYSLWK
jgi:anaerobic C4-dicarboxylate transporter DcuA